MSELSSYLKVGRVLDDLVSKTTVRLTLSLTVGLENHGNKAGYTANTSRGRVGRGGNACFHTFQLDHHGPTNRPTNQPTDGRTDKASYRVASPRLKK